MIRDMGCKFCDETAPNEEQPGLYALPHSEHAASAAAAYFSREDEHCRLEDQGFRELSERQGELIDMFRREY